MDISIQRVYFSSNQRINLCSIYFFWFNFRFCIHLIPKMAADLCGYKLALVASFKINILLNFKLKNETSRANLNKNKKIFKWRSFNTFISFNAIYFLSTLFCTAVDHYCQVPLHLVRSREAGTQFSQPLCNKSLNESNRVEPNKKCWMQNVLLKFKKKRLNRSNRIEGYQNVLNAKSEVEPKNSILNINLCVELN